MWRWKMMLGATFDTSRKMIFEYNLMHKAFESFLATASNEYWQYWVFHSNQCGTKQWKTYALRSETPPEQRRQVSPSCVHQLCFGGKFPKEGRNEWKHRRPSSGIWPTLGRTKTVKCSTIHDLEKTREKEKENRKLLYNGNPENSTRTTADYTF